MNNIRLKEIRFDNPILYIDPRPLVEGDVILLGECGMWPVTQYDPKRKSWMSGGMTLGIGRYEKCVKIFDTQFLNWLKSIQKYKKGDVVRGYCECKLDRSYIPEIVEGVISESYGYTTAQGSQWVYCKDGYTRSIDCLSYSLVE